tara:strand:- start:57 stop:290 length:234 start_codon:yes stop_codon:yes gene_type:complete
MGTGWVGRSDQVLAYLSAVRADKDSEGNFMLYGSPPVVDFFGDLVIDDACEYTVNGERKKLAAGLQSTSYGTHVKVF